MQRILHPYVVGKLHRPQPVSSNRMMECDSHDEAHGLTRTCPYMLKGVVHAQSVAHTLPEDSLIEDGHHWGGGTAIS